MIIGIKEEDKVLLAYSAFDMRIPTTVDDMTSSENTCVWKITRTPHTVMGCGICTAESDAFRYEERLFRGEISVERLLDDIIPAMENYAKDKEYIGDGKGRFEEFLIAQRGRLFRITDEHTVEEVDSYTVIGGSEEEHAKGALYATAELPALDRIRKVFEFISARIQATAYPISVIDTKTGKLQILAAGN